MPAPCFTFSLFRDARSWDAWTSGRANKKACSTGLWACGFWNRPYIGPKHSRLRGLATGVYALRSLVYGLNWKRPKLHRRLRHSVAWLSGCFPSPGILGLSLKVKMPGLVLGVSGLRENAPPRRFFVSSGHNLHTQITRVSNRRVSRTQISIGLEHEQDKLNSPALSSSIQNREKH